MTSLSLSENEYLLLHNPRCSKSRATKALLEERGVAFAERQYLEDPLSREELEELGRRLGRPISEWVRSKEASFQAAGLGPESEGSAVLGAMVEHPVLMERPILLRGARAAIGRPPEDVLLLLD